MGNDTGADAKVDPANASELPDETGGCGLLCNSLLAILVVAAVAFLLTLVVLAVGTKKRDARMMKKQKEELDETRSTHNTMIVLLKLKLKSLQDRSPEPNEKLLKIARGPDALSSVRLNELDDGGNAGAAKAKLQRLMDEFQARMGDQTVDVETPSNSRLRTIPTRKDTQVVLTKSNYRTTVNAMLDFYGRQILVGQAPLSTRIVEHWELLYQENVGVVVWIGSLKDATGNERIFPYVPLEINKTLSFGQGKVVTTSVGMNENGCNTYYVDATLVPGESKKRHLTVIHIPTWPDSPSLNDSNLAKAAAHIASQQSIHASYGLPTVLVHGSNGVCPSIALIMIYIGRQMLIHCRSVDPVGLLEYICQHRYLAMSTKILTQREIETHMAVVEDALRATVSDTQKWRDKNHGSATSATALTETIDPDLGES